MRANVIANYLGQGWTALMGLVFIPFYIKYLGVESFGLIGIFVILNAWMILLDMGMSPTLSREMARFTGGAHEAQSVLDLLRSIEIIGIGISFVIALGIWLASEWLASDWLRVEKLPIRVVANSIAIMGVVTALRFIENIYRSGIAGLQRQAILNIVLSVMATVRGLGALGILIWVSPTIAAFVVWQGILSIVTVGVFATVMYRSLPVSEHAARFSLRVLKDIRNFAGGMMSITLLALLLTQVDKILLSRTLTLQAFGYYALAGSVANALYMFTGPITAAFFPRVTELIACSDETTLIASYHKSAQLVSVLMGTAAIVLIVFGDIVMLLWTKDPTLTHQVVPLIAVLSLGTLLNGLMWIPYQTQLAYGWTSLSIKVNTIAIAIDVPAVLWATTVYGAIGAAWIWVGLNLGYFTISVHLMHRRLLTREKWRWYIEDVMMPLLGGTVVAVLLRWIIPTSVDAATQLFTLVFTGGFVLTATALSAKAVRQQLVQHFFRNRSSRFG
jgi:O-antigen/teichoic acid export membrane protein